MSLYDATIPKVINSVMAAEAEVESTQDYVENTWSKL